MRRFSKITIGAVSLLVGAAVTVPAALAQSEAALEASSFAETNNHCEPSLNCSTSAGTRYDSNAVRYNDSNSTAEAAGPFDTSIMNLKDPFFNFPQAGGKTWGRGPTWGGSSVTPELSSLSITPQRTAKSMPVLAPHTQTSTFHPSNAQLAARPVYSFTSHKVIHTGTSANSHYTYIKKQIRQAEVSM